MAALYQRQGLDAVMAGQPAVHFFEKAAYWAPRDAEIADNLGRAFREIHSEEARQVGVGFLRRAVELNPFQAYLHGDLAEALFEDGKVDEALEENEIACRLFPQKTLYVRRKAKYLLALGRREEWERWTTIADQMEQQDKALRP
jgi:tetratricopeptide (TPR) repeat protein